MVLSPHRDHPLQTVCEQQLDILATCSADKVTSSFLDGRADDKYAHSGIAQYVAKVSFAFPKTLEPQSLQVEKNVAHLLAKLCNYLEPPIYTISRWKVCFSVSTLYAVPWIALRKPCPRIPSLHRRLYGEL